MEGKKLSELRVIDLKAELESRGVDKSGNKPALIDRLKQILIREGHNPDEYIFGNKSNNSANDSKDVVKQGESQVPDNHQSIVNNELKTASSNEMSALIQDYVKKSEDTESTGSGHDGVSAEITSADKLDCEDLDDDQQVLTTEVNEDLGDEHEEFPESGEDREKIEEKIKANAEDEEDVAKKNAEVATDGGEMKSDVATSVPSKRDENSEKKKEARKKEASLSDSGKPQDRREKSSSEKHAESRNLWITNLAAETCAADLKNHFIDYGKVTCAKVVACPSDPTKFFGLVTMATYKEANNALARLHRSRLLGQRIYVERAKVDGSGPLNSSKSKNPTENGSNNGDGKKFEIKEDKGKHDSGDDKHSRSRTLSPARSHERKHIPFEEVIRLRENQRMRFREKIIQREIYYRQRRDEERLRREKEIIRLERIRLEREKAELLRLERERQRLERERLEREKAELLAHKMRLQASLNRKRRPDDRTYSSSSSKYFRSEMKHSSSHKQSSSSSARQGSGNFKDRYNHSHVSSRKGSSRHSKY